jgi:hypothetical protein
VVKRLRWDTLFVVDPRDASSGTARIRVGEDAYSVVDPYNLFALHGEGQLCRRWGGLRPVTPTPTHRLSNIRSRGGSFNWGVGRGLHARGWPPHACEHLLCLGRSLDGALLQYSNGVGS